MGVSFVVVGWRVAGALKFFTLAGIDRVYRILFCREAVTSPQKGFVSCSLHTVSGHQFLDRYPIKSDVNYTTEQTMREERESRERERERVRLRERESEREREREREGERESERRNEKERT